MAKSDFFILDFHWVYVFLSHFHFNKDIRGFHTAMTKYRNFKTNIPRKGISGSSVPISTFMRLWVISIFPRLVCLFCWRKYVDRSWDYINRSQTHECGNWGWCRAILRKGIHKWDFRCSTPSLYASKNLKNNFLILLSFLKYFINLRSYKEITMKYNFLQKRSTVYVQSGQYRSWNPCLYPSCAAAVRRYCTESEVGLLTFLVRMRLDLRLRWASCVSEILSVKARLVLFQWTLMSLAALLIRLFTS